MSTETTPGKLNSSSSGAYGVIGAACQILRREAGGVRYDPRCLLTIPPLIGIRYGLVGMARKRASLSARVRLPPVSGNNSFQDCSILDSNSWRVSAT